MPRKRDLTERLYTGFERMIAPSASPLTWNLFAIAVYRLLLGYEETLPSSWQDSPRRVAELVREPAATLPERLEALAYREIAGEDTAADLRALLPTIDATSQDVNTVLSGLACSMEGDQEARERWLQSGLSHHYIETEQPYLFEMLSLVRSDPSEADRVANAVALLVHKNLVGREPLTVSPLVCGLGSLARRAGTTARRLLHDRLSRVDKLLFAEGETPRFTVKGPELTPVDQKTCELRLTIRGDGAFDAGVDPAEALTRFLSETLTKLVMGLSRRREKSRGELESALDGGICRTVVRLARQVTLEERDEHMLSRRIGIAWEQARRQLRGIACKEELHIERAGG
jgi:hypothetical protein